MVESYQLTNWALLDLKYEYLDDGYKIVAYTDTPVHLYCRMTTTKPEKHPEPVLRRGTLLRNDVRFCFVVYEDNEQKEPGDTLVHTFLKPAWPVCETRYFYFLGTIGGQASKSDTAIFVFHFPAPPPEPPPLVESTLYPRADGGWYSCKISPLTPTTHWDKVRYAADGKCVWNDVAIEKDDAYLFTPPPLWAEFKLILKLTIRMRMQRSNWSAKHAVILYSHSVYWQGPWLQQAPMTYGWLSYPFTSNPCTGQPWDYDDLAPLQAGLALYDSGIPSGIYCDAYELVITWKP